MWENSAEALRSRRSPKFEHDLIVNAADKTKTAAIVAQHSVSYPGIVEVVDGRQRSGREGRHPEAGRQRSTSDIDFWTESRFGSSPKDDGRGSALH